MIRIGTSDDKFLERAGMEPEIVELEHGTYCFVRPKGKIASLSTTLSAGKMQQMRSSLAFAVESRREEAVFGLQAADTPILDLLLHPLVI